MYETLSRFLAGELDESEAQVVRNRIEEDPAWRSAWAVMSALPEEIGALPTPAPPPALDQALFDRLSPPPLTEVRREAEPAPSSRGVATPPPRATPRWLVGVPALLAAGLFGALLMRSPVPEVELRLGAQRIDGEVHLLAGDTVIDLDGVAEVTVEPADLHARETEGMNRSHLISALAGSVVTLAVVEGRAVVREGDAPVVTVSAGQTHRSGTGAETAARSSGGASGSADGRVAELESELADLRLRYAMVKGQLDGRLGQPMEFPEGLPPGYRPGDFEPRARAIADEVPGTELVRTECDEYPCVAYYKSTSGDSNWGTTLGQVLSRVYGEQAGIFQMGLRIEDEGQVAALAAVAVIPTDEAELAEAVRARLSPRVEPTMNELESEERARHVAP